MERAKMTLVEMAMRENMVSHIEGMTGTLSSMQWNLVSTEDISKILRALLSKKGE